MKAAPSATPLSASMPIDGIVEPQIQLVEMASLEDIWSAEAQLPLSLRKQCEHRENHVSDLGGLYRYESGSCASALHRSIKQIFGRDYL